MQIIRDNAFALAVQGVGLIVLILNLWLSTKLYPLAQNIDQIATKVEAAESQIAELKEDAKLDNNILIKIESIQVTLEDLQERIERIDTRLARHMGI